MGDALPEPPARRGRTGTTLPDEAERQRFGVQEQRASVGRVRLMWSRRMRITQRGCGVLTDMAVAAVR